MHERDTPVYSQLFHCIHDEQGAVGNIGHGTHCSVFRCACFHDAERKLSHTGFVQDFAVIWDEDHDARIIPVIEALYMEGYLHAIAMIGERKGGLTIILRAAIALHMGNNGREAYEKAVRSTIDHVVRKKFGDYWNVDFGTMSDIPGETPSVHKSLIQDDAFKVDTYLRNIDNLWELGIKRWA